MEKITTDVGTSTEDLKGPRLCLFYFNQPFGILAPSPPKISAVPQDISEAILKMNIFSPYSYSSDDYNTSFADSTTMLSRNTDSDISNIKSEQSDQYHEIELDVLNKRSKSFATTDDSIKRLKDRIGKNNKSERSEETKSNLNNNKVDSKPLNDSILNSDASSDKSELSDRIKHASLIQKLKVKENKVQSKLKVNQLNKNWGNVSKCAPYYLPPLNVHIEKIDHTRLSERFDKELPINVNKINLPPIDSELLDSRESNKSTHERRCRLRPIKLNSGGVRKLNKKADIRKNITGLIHRSLKGKEIRNPPALQETLHTVREAWATPKSLLDRCRYSSGSTRKEASFTSQPKRMPRRTDMLDPMTPRPGASRGLFTRRYSVPEIIMRKYHLKQQGSEPDPSETWSAPSRPLSPASPPCGHRYPKRDKEPMRKSTMLRRMFGNNVSDPTASCIDCFRYLSDRDLSYSDSLSRESKSLDGSRSELRNRTSLMSQSRMSYACDCSKGISKSSKPPLPGWGSSKRQRINSPCRRNDDMLRMAMKNSYDRSEEQLRASRKESMSSLITSSLYNEPPSSREQLTKSDPEVTSVVNDENTQEEYVKTNDGMTFTVDDQCNLVDEIQKEEFVKPEYEQLEIVVTERFNNNYILSHSNDRLAKTKSIYSQPHEVNGNLELDQFVSHILVESLNSLNEQLEEMNTSVNGTKKFSIIEKEIKVKLQNTGINTVVHLSPDSNNTIIFGNKEIWESDKLQEDPPDDIKYDLERIETQIEEQTELVLSSSENNTLEGMKRNNNNESEKSIPKTTNEHFNKAVMEQIQKLFDSPDINYSGISHIEISKVGVYVDDAITEDNNILNNNECINNDSVTNLDGKISKVTSGNYYELPDAPVIIPRFSAVPNTESMEVQNSSCDDQDAMKSDPSSLVDSLDDPTSPRFYLQRKHPNELVTSTMDVLELLPSSEFSEVSTSKDKSEAFFIRIREDSCDCEKENIIVADHLPDLIKQRLIKRHNKRKLRMEQLKRKNIRLVKKEIEKKRKLEFAKARKELEKECLAILNSIIEEVVYKLAHEENKIRKKNIKTDSLKQRGSKKNVKLKSRSEVTLDNMDSFKINKKGEIQFNNENNKGQYDENINKHSRKPEHNIQSSSSEPIIEEKPPKRIYHKSEIKDGKKCVEILEILEYADSSTDMTISDEGTNSGKTRSKIPLPIYENVHKIPRIRHIVNNTSSSHLIEKTTNLNENLSVDCLDQYRNIETKLPNILPIRRASVPQTEQRIRSGSLNKFLQTFDNIPEENTNSSNENLNKSHSNLLNNKVSHTKSQTIDKMTSNKSTSPFKITESENKTFKNVATSPSKKLALTSTTSNTPSVVGKSLEKDRIKPKKDFSLGGPKILWNGLYKAKKSTFEDDMPNQKYSKRSNKSTKQEDGSVTSKMTKDLSTKDKNTTSRQLFRSKVSISETTANENVKKSGDVIKQSKTDSEVSKYAKTRADYIKRNNLRNDDRAPFKRLAEEDSISSNSLSDESDNDSGSSLLCSLAPRWLQMGHLGKARRQYRKKIVQEEQSERNPAGGWSVTVAGNCFATLPTDVQMRLTFPKQTHATSHLDSGFNEESWRTMKEMTGAQNIIASTAKETGFLPPTQVAKSVAVLMKKVSSDSSVQATKSSRKNPDCLPNVHTNIKTKRTKSQSSVKTRRRFSLQCWQAEDIIPQLKGPDNLSVTGNAIVPERKPRVPTMSERDVTRINTTRQYVRSRNM